MKQGSVLLARAFSQKTRSLLVEQALLSLEAKLVQPASLVQSLASGKNLPEWLLFEFDSDESLPNGGADTFTPALGLHI